MPCVDAGVKRRAGYDPAHGRHGPASARCKQRHPEAAAAVLQEDG